MKKFLALMLSLIMITSFCACGKEQNAEKYCFNCGKGITENASFCEHCGANIKEHLAQNSSSTSTNATSTTTSATSTTTSTASTTSKTTSSSKPTTSTTNSSKPTTNTVTSAQLDIQQKIKNKGENITVLVPGNTNSSSLQVKAQGYKELTGGTVSWVSSDGYSEMQMKLVSMHMSDEAPDVYQFTSQDYPSILYKGILAPLDNLIDLNHKVFDNNRTYINTLRWDGKCYLIPTIGTTRDLWVNARILRNAGIPKSEWPDAQYKAGTWTWDAFLNIVKRVSDPENGVYGTMYDTNLHIAWPASAGVDFIKLENSGFKGNAKDPNVTRAMTMYKQIYTNPNYVPIKSGESAMELFKRGKICMWYYMTSATGDEIIGEQYANGDVFFTAFPRDPNLDTHYRMGDIHGKSIPTSAKHKNGAVAYILCEYASDYYQAQIDEMDKENYNWTEELFEYMQEDLFKRPAVICFSLGFKGLQTTIGRACFTTIFEEDWSTIANSFDTEAQQIIDTQQ